MRDVRYDIGDILEMECSDKKTHRYLILGYTWETNQYTVVEYDFRTLWLTTLNDMVRIISGAPKKIGHVDISALQGTVDNDVPDETPVKACKVCEKAKEDDYYGHAYGLSFRTVWDDGVAYYDVNWKFCPECGRRRK